MRCRYLRRPGPWPSANAQRDATGHTSGYPSRHGTLVRSRAPHAVRTFPTATSRRRRSSGAVPACPPSFGVSRPRHNLRLVRVGEPPPTNSAQTPWLRVPPQCRIAVPGPRAQRVYLISQAVLTLPLPMLPNFVIIGAQKSASTYAHLGVAPASRSSHASGGDTLLRRSHTSARGIQNTWSGSLLVHTHP